MSTVVIADEGLASVGVSETVETVIIDDGAGAPGPPGPPGPPGGGGGLPVGGALSQALVKQSGVDGDADWETLIPSDIGIPLGGTIGEVLAKASGTDNDFDWIAPPSGTGGLPAGGAAADLLVKQSGVDGDALFQAVTAVDVGADPVGTAAAGDTTILDALGTAAHLNVGTTSSDVASGDAPQNAVDALPEVLFDSIRAPADPVTNRAEFVTEDIGGGEMVTSLLGGNLATLDDIAAGGGGVASVNGEVGAVTLSAADIPFTPDGTIAATTVQAAIVEVRDEAGAGSGDLLSTNNLSDLASAPTARTNLGLGTAAVAASADFEAAGAVATHSADTTAVHGIADTTLLETATGAQAKVDTHSADTTAVHGIADTTALVLTGDARLSDARTPTAHKTSHENGGADELALDASQITTGTHATARLGTGTANSSTFLRGDQTWAAPAGGGGGDLLAANNLSDLASAPTARTNLGLGTIATGTETAYALLAGRAGGQPLHGDTASAGNLVLRSTFHATKGKILLDDATWAGTIANPGVAAGSATALQNSVISDSVTLTADPTLVKHGTPLLIDFDQNLNYTGGGFGPKSSLAVVPGNWGGWTNGPTTSFPRGVVSIEGTTTFMEPGGLVGGGCGFIDLRVTKNIANVAKSIVGVNGVFIDNHVYIADGATITQSLGGYQPTLNSYGHLGFSSQPFFTVDATNGGQLNNIISCPFYSGACFLPNTQTKIAWGYFIDDATWTYNNIPGTPAFTGTGVVDALVGIQMNAQVTGTQNICFNYGDPDPSVTPLFRILGSGAVVAYQGLAGSEASAGLLGITSTTHAVKGPIILDASALFLGPVDGHTWVGGIVGGLGMYKMLDVSNPVTMDGNGGAAGTGNGFSVIDVSSTVTFNKTGSIFGHAVIGDASTFKNTSGTNRTLGQFYGLFSAHTIQADAATVISDGDFGVYHQPITSRITSGDLTVGEVIAVHSGATIGANTTVVERLGFHFVDATGAGTLPIQVGIEIDALAKATTNIGIRNAATSVLSGGVYGSISAGGNLLIGSTTHATKGTIQLADATTAPTFSATGLTGATATGRWAGVTASGAPASGTFNTGDVVTTRDGNIFICSAGGSPGTWMGIANTVINDAFYQPKDTDLTVIAGLADPNADRVLFWDDSAGAYAYLTIGANLTITGTTLDAAGGTGAPTTVDYLVGTADGGLSNEIVVGTTPNGELGGTWGAITVDATHSGSSHASVQAAAEATAAAALTAHTGDTSDAHDASAVSVVSTTLVGTGTDAQAVFEELDDAVATNVTNIATNASAIAAHLADTADAHDASAISILDTAADFTATDVEGALAELQTADEADEAALAAHLADTGDAHDASAISFTPDGSIAATDVQAAIIEVRDEAAGGGAPSTADYLVGTAQGGLSAEIVVGATPNGELGGTWGAITVDATHSGSSHAGIQSAAEATAQAALDAHTADTADAHDASAISVVSTTLVGTGTDVQAVFEELDDAIVLKAPLASPTFTGTVTIPTGGSIIAPTGLVKGDVGLGNVDNIADASKAFAGSQITSGTVAEARIDSAIARDSEVAAAYQPLDADLTAYAANPAVQRETTIASNATWSPNADTTDIFTVTAQAVAATTINNPSGTPVQGQRLVIRVKDNGTARALTWSGTQWRVLTGLNTLPGATILGRTHYLQFVFNATDTKWDLVHTDTYDQTTVDFLLATKANSNPLATDSLWGAKADLVVATANDTAARLAVGTFGQVPTADTTETPGLIYANPQSLNDRYLAPNALRSFETMQRLDATGDTAGPTTATVVLLAIALPKNFTVARICFVSGATAAGTPTNWWFSLCNSAYTTLRSTADQTTTAWAANTKKRISLSSAFVTTYEGLYYVAFMMKATTVISMPGYTMANNVMSSSATLPYITATGDAGQSTAPSDGTLLAASPTNRTTGYYAYVD